MYLNLSTGPIGHDAPPLDDLVRLATTHGFGGIDPPMEQFEAMIDPEAAAARVRGEGLRWGTMPFPVEFRRDDAAAQAGLDRLARWARVAERIGCDRCATWLLPFHDELPYEANFAAHVRRLRPACRILADHGIRMGFEFVGPLTLRAGHAHAFIHTMGQALALAGAIDTGNVGLLLDSFHWYTSVDTVESLRGQLTSADVVLVHVNDAIAGRGPDEQIDNERALPGDTGQIDLDGFVGALKAIAYDGPVTAEPFMPELGKLPLEEAVARTAKAMGRLPL